MIQLSDDGREGNQLGRHPSLGLCEQVGQQEFHHNAATGVCDELRLVNDY